MIRRFLTLGVRGGRSCQAEGGVGRGLGPKGLGATGHLTDHCSGDVRVFSSYKKRGNVHGGGRTVWQINPGDEPDFSDRAQRMREEIKRLTPEHVDDLDLNLQDQVPQPDDEIGSSGSEYEDGAEEESVERDILFEHPDMQYHTRKDKETEHGYFLLDRYGEESYFEFPMDINDESPWYQHCYKFLFEAKAQNITYYRNLRPEADHILVCTCMSRLHIANTAFGLMDLGKDLRVKHLNMEGQPQDEWVCVDAGNTMVHIFSQGDRDYYSIDLLYTVEHPYMESEKEATG